MLLESGHKTVSGGQFYWGNSLLKGNGGAQRFPQTRRKLVVERKGRRELNCKTDNPGRREAGLSDPAVPCGRAVAQRIKVTLGITG